MRLRSASLAVPLVLLVALGAISCSALRFGRDQEEGALDAAYVARTTKPYPDAEAAGYVARVGRRLEAALAHPELAFTFTLLDDEERNAFALPGGYTYVTRGVLAAASTEDELAGTMAHEMIHAAKRHRAKKRRRAILPNTLKIPGRIAGAILGEGVGDVVNAPVNFISGANLARYSRRIEKDADLEGIKLMAKAGYDPMALATILSKFSAIDTTTTGRAEHRDYLSTHPFTQDRADYVRKASRELTIAPSTHRPDSHFQAIEGLLYGRNPQRRFINGRQALSEELGLALRFPAGWDVVPLDVGIASASPDGDGLLYISPSPVDAPPKSIGPRFAKIASTEFGGEIHQSREVNRDGVIGYVVSLRDDSGPAPAYLHLVWIRNKGQTVQIVGMGSQSHQEPLRSTGRSIRAFRSSDRADMTKLVIAVAKSTRGESLATFSRRTGNQWTLPLTATMNGLSPDVPLTGEPLKITRRRSVY